jgi:hypothetical protein
LGQSANGSDAPAAKAARKTTIKAEKVRIIQKRLTQIASGIILLIISFVLVPHTGVIYSTGGKATQPAKVKAREFGCIKHPIRIACHVH